ncbi:hypothetical protein [Magnetospirillum fulvum]|uniref:Uncharacterized protein n=1 Tax=Magnetospirillum fulvum MGU-K5 TaxID=1316936 RepID=S9SFL4_MAGFU|nr:hypothetical protein [Magnetospirillum fulvum]EPY03529.1 hypothetical protein K678_00420 [Magnetospirillum fulvum MGU-K5]
MSADLSRAIVPKSDQLNADDLIAGPRTITVSKVTVQAGTEQPVAIHFEGDNGKPWKPCKSMCRVLVNAWGADGANYVGRSITLRRDPNVKWGGMAVGGIRISHLSHIAQQMVMALTETKGSRKPFTVNPLQQVAPVEDDLLQRIAGAQTIEDLERLRPEMRGNTAALTAARARGEAIRAAAAKQQARDEDPFGLPPIQTLSPEAAAGLAQMQAATTEAEVEAVWEALDLEVCRELGSGALDEQRARVNGEGA